MAYLILIFVFLNSPWIVHAQLWIDVCPSELKSITALKEYQRKDSMPVEANCDDAYRLLFVSAYDGKTYSVGEEEADRARRSRLKNFTEQLNKYGAHGYKLISGIRGLPYAILKLDDGRYEYDWFETTSSVHFAKSGLEEKLAEMSERGFRIGEHFAISQLCEIENLDSSILTEKCTYKDLFLVEREKSSKNLIDQILINSFPGWGAKPSVEMTSLIDEKLAEGFYPIRAISKFEILLERAKDKNDILEDKPDVQIVRSGWGTNNVQKKVNELAKQGYRLAMTNNGIAILYRNKETAKIPVSYVWLRADRKNFEKELAKLQEKGARYSTTYPNEKGTRNTLIFEQNLDGKGGRGEFRILSFEFDSTENQAEGKVYIDLTPSSKEAVKKMNELAKQGFVVRDLFDGDKISVILERVR